MSHRRWPDEVEQQPPRETDFGPLFAPATPAIDGLTAGFTALEQTAARANHRRLIDQLVPIAQELARVCPQGVTVRDVRRTAVRRGLLPANAKGRELAFLGAVMRKAGLVATEEFRRSDLDASHGNLHRVYQRR